MSKDIDIDCECGHRIHIKWQDRYEGMKLYPKCSLCGRVHSWNETRTYSISDEKVKELIT